MEFVFTIILVWVVWNFLAPIVVGIIWGLLSVGFSILTIPFKLIKEIFQEDKEKK